MNKLTLSIIEINGHYEVQPYIDDKKLLDNEYKGLNPQEFICHSKLLENGKILLGLTDDMEEYTAIVSIQSNIVKWETHKAIYEFDLSQYIKEAEKYKINAVKSSEAYATDLAEFLLEYTETPDGYKFYKAIADAQRKCIVVIYRNCEQRRTYEINWNGLYEEWGLMDEIVSGKDYGDAGDNIGEFIDTLIYGQDYLTTKILYKIWHQLYGNSLYHSLRTALLYEHREGLIIALAHAADYDAVDQFSYFKVQDHIVQGLWDVMSFCFDNKKYLDKAYIGYADMHSYHLLRLRAQRIENPLAKKVVAAIITEKCISKRNNMVLRAFEKVWSDTKYKISESVLNIALNCDTQDERTVALLYHIEYSDTELRELQNELDFNDAVMAALQCFQCNENKDDAVMLQRITENPIARKVKIEELRDNIYNLDYTAVEQIEEDKKILRMLQVCK